MDHTHATILMLIGFARLCITLLLSRSQSKKLLLCLLPQLWLDLAAGPVLSGKRDLYLDMVVGYSMKQQKQLQNRTQLLDQHDQENQLNQRHNFVRCIWSISEFA